MLKLISIKKSDKPEKKFQATFQKDSRTITTHFGAKGMSDYRFHRDDRRKALYIQRHEKREDWNNPVSAGSLSRWILWNKPTLAESIKDYKKRFNL